MTVMEVAKRDLDRDAPPGPTESRTATQHGMGMRPYLITLVAVIVAGLLGWATWAVYMQAPWTRDATVRAYVVMMAPEVAGRIVELNVVDNKYVRKNDLLLVIDPTNYSIAVSQAEAAVAQIEANQAQLSQAQAALVFAREQADRYQNLALKGAGSIQNAQQFSSQLLQ